MTTALYSHSASTLEGYGRCPRIRVRVSVRPSKVTDVTLAHSFRLVCVVTLTVALPLALTLIATQSGVVFKSRAKKKGEGSVGKEGSTNRAS